MLVVNNIKMKKKQILSGMHQTSTKLGLKLITSQRESNIFKRKLIEDCYFVRENYHTSEPYIHASDIESPHFHHHNSSLIMSHGN